MLLKKVPRKNVAKNNRRGMLLKKILLEEFVEYNRSRILPNKNREKVPLKTTIPKCC